jgi:hypothetical protein
MKKLMLCLAIMGILSSCGNNTEEPDVNDGGETISARGLTQEQEDFATTFKNFITAFQAKDYDKLNAFAGEDGVYVIYPGFGAYSEFVQYEDMKALASDESISEALGYFEQALGSGEGLSGEIEYEELDSLDPCEVKEYIYLGDYGATNILTSSYKALQENLGEEGDAKEFESLLGVEKNVKIKVYVGIGEEAEVLYFTNNGTKWFLSIMDLSECGG